MSPRRLLAVLALGLVASGCASTRSGELGMLATRDPLVTLVVSEQRTIVAQECPPRITATPILGCQTSRPVLMPDGNTARVVKIVRFTDALPSEMAFEIDLHELCHAIAALQPIRDPCHDGNGGQLLSGTGQKPSIVSR
jgi:hypothetical protein